MFCACAFACAGCRACDVVVHGTVAARQPLTREFEVSRATAEPAARLRTTPLLLSLHAGGAFDALQGREYKAEVSPHLVRVRGLGLGLGLGLEG